MRGELLGYVKKSNKTSGLLPKSDIKTFVTCVHVRRGDFLLVGFAASDARFIKSALKFIEEKEDPKKQNKVIVFFGDSIKFMKKLSNDLLLVNGKQKKISHYISTNSPTDDLIYAKENCDAVLISGKMNLDSTL
ncbi:hypothetical protein CRE_23713 [Caenorhabditis remanei]|uniref:Uncharacterized protein n=1 Tax=Caenorhabditis remanei TaxID=31234 RepID=E3N9B3_CAERE|nr:hypothetical protein CRE_23713 [Caenorhabditis remanei]